MAPHHRGQEGGVMRCQVVDIAAGAGNQRCRFPATWTAIVTLHSNEHAGRECIGARIHYCTAHAPPEARRLDKRRAA